MNTTLKISSQLGICPDMWYKLKNKKALANLSLETYKLVTHKCFSGIALKCKLLCKI